ncbi:MAG: siderophore ABC transporter substrate-binding protein [Eubacteriales bacterium]|nr:siderophore ABC transporter substrate-binding protein [Eubacteriales bacterium]
MKKLITIAMSLILATSLFGCGASNSANSGGETVQEETDAPRQMVTIEHSKGTVEVPKNPKKIAVFDFGILDIIDSLGIDVDLALPVDSIPTYLSKYEKKATNAGGIKEPNIEELFNYKPEVIFISGRQESFYEELSEIAPTVYIEINGANYVNSVYYNTAVVNEIFDGKKELAAEKFSDIYNKVEEVKKKAKKSEEKALVILANSGAMSTYGRGSRFGIIFDDLGFTPVDEDIEVSTHGDEISYEYIAEKNPDIIFVIDRDAVVGGETDNSEILNNDLVNETNAVKSGKVINLDPEIWYIAGGGISSINTMIEEVEAAFKE